jgi:hypothetical protein
MTAFELKKVTAKLPLAAIGSNGSNENRLTAKLPTPFRVGSNGSESCADKKPARKSRKKAAEVTP